MKKNKIKTFVLDTNVLLSDPGALNAFDEHNVIIPLIVLEELDNHKNRPDEVGKNARLVSRQLDSYRSEGKAILSKGVKLPNKGILKVLPYVKTTTESPLLSDDKADNVIIAFALELSKTVDCTLVSKDVNVRIKCDCLGLKSEDYLRMRVAGSQEEIYSGVANLTVDPDVINAFYGNVPFSLGLEHEEKLHPNQIVIMKDHNRSAIGKYAGKGEPIQKILAIEDVFGLKPRNKEQTFALDLLLDDNIKLVTITGAAGCVVAETLVSIKLENIDWEIPEPANTYSYACSENSKKDSDS